MFSPTRVIASSDATLELTPGGPSAVRLSRNEDVVEAGATG
jgi:hypothetical protein